jgi:acyl carrier protein
MSAATLQRVIRIIVSATGLSPEQRLDASTPLIGAGIALDSVAVLELLVALEKEFKIEADPEELRRANALATVGALADFVESKAKASER